MRITIEVAESVMEQIQKATGQTEKTHAVSQALSEYLRLIQKRRFIEKVLSGKTDYSLTNDALETHEFSEGH